MEKRTASELDYDVCIAGGGMVGASTALLLAQRCPHLRIAVLEAFPFSESDERSYQPSYDGRATALSYSSREIFQELKCWKNILPQAAAIRAIHVSDKGHSGNTFLSAEQHNVDALGYVVENRWLGQQLMAQLKQHEKITLLAPALAKSLSFKTDHANLELESGDNLSCQLVVIADGANSLLRKNLGVQVEQRSYDQHAVIAGVQLNRPHKNIAYERFTDTGPMALLPMAAADRCALVWTVPEHLLSAVMDAEPDAQLRLLQSRFGSRAGQMIGLQGVASYPLSLMVSKEQVRSRVVILGNSAHSLHPVAGQGFNLSLRDADELTRRVAKAALQQQDLGCLSMLQAYVESRQSDQQRVIAASDQLVRWFSSKNLAKAALRNTALLGLDALPSVRDQFARLAMGLD